jgi:hypothetical protein
VKYSLYRVVTNEHASPDAADYYATAFGTTCGIFLFFYKFQVGTVLGSRIIITGRALKY